MPPGRATRAWQRRTELGMEKPRAMATATGLRLKPSTGLLPNKRQIGQSLLLREVCFFFSKQYVQKMTYPA
jgi:hypothetical protein